MTNRNSQNALPIDFSQCMDSNLKQLGDRRFDVEAILSRPADWCLLDFLNEYARRGCVSENVLCSLMSIVGSVSHHSFVTNIFTGAKVWLNLAYHIIGSSGTNKSFIPEEMIYAHHELNRVYPGVYSSNEFNENDEEETLMKRSTGSKRVPWTMLVSTITEAGLSQYLAHSDVTLVNQDGDQALKQLNYYDQGSAGTAVFCWAIDGSQPGQSRTTGVERITNRLAEPSKLSLFVASTGSKFTPAFQKIQEEKVNDGVFGRVLYLHQPIVDELPQPTLVRQGSVPNHTHIAHAAHILLHECGPFEFRFVMSPEDMADALPPTMSPEMIAARTEQGVEQPDFVRVGFDADNLGTATNVSSQSSYQTCKDHCQELWLEANTNDMDHMRCFWRKSPVHLFKVICTLKIVRVIFSLLAKKPLGSIRCDQGDRANKVQSIPRSFIDNVQAEFRAYVETNCQIRPVGSSGNEKTFRVFTIDKGDVDAAHRLLKYQLETARILFSVDHLREIVSRRVGRPFRLTLPDNTILQKTNSELRFDEAMHKLMTCTSIIVTKQFITNSRIENGGFLKEKTNHSMAVRPDKVISELVARRLLVQCGMVQGTRLGSFYRQFPVVIIRDPTLSACLQQIGIEYDRYVSTFKHAIFPRELKLNAVGIKVLVDDIRWISYYHTFPFEQSVQKLIRSRLVKEEIILVDGQYEKMPIEDAHDTDERYETTESAELQPFTKQLSHRLDTLGSLLQHDSNMSETSPLAHLSSLLLSTANTSSSLSHATILHSLLPVASVLPSIIANNVDAESRASNVTVDDLMLLNIGSASSDHDRHDPPLLPSTCSIVSPTFSDSGHASRLLKTTWSIAPPTLGDDFPSLVTAVSVVSPLSIVSPTQLPTMDRSSDDNSNPVMASQPYPSPVDRQRNNDDQLAYCSEEEESTGPISSLRPPDEIIVSNTDVASSSHEIWSKLILNNHVVMTRTYLSRNIKSVKPAVRTVCVQRLVEMGLLAERDDVFTGEARAFLKCPPTNTSVQKTLLHFNISVVDYEASFNGGKSFLFVGATNTVLRAQIKRPSELKAKFTSAFRRSIEHDQWYNRFLFLADADVEAANNVQPAAMSSSTAIDSFTSQIRSTPKLKRANNSSDSSKSLRSSKRKKDKPE